MFARFFGRQQNPYSTLLGSRYTLNVSGIEDSIKSQVFVIWVLLPSLAVLGSLDFTGNRTFSVTCADGYPWWAFLPIVVVAAYHCKVESRLWQGVLDFLTRPEITIAQHYGIPGRVRLCLMVLSVVEILNLFTDLIFPFVARDCSSATSQIWIESWEHTDVPWAKVSARFIQKFGLWGLSATCVILSFSAQLINAFWTVSRPFLNRQRLQVMTQCTHQSVPGMINAEPDNSPHQRASGLYDSAVKYAPVHGHQNQDAWREWNMDTAGGTRNCGTTATDEHEHNFRLPGRREELIDADELESINVYSVRQFWSILVFHIILGPLLSLYLQVTFFGLAFGLTSASGKAKLLFSITVSLITLIHRSRQQMALMFDFVWVVIFVIFIVVWTSLCLIKLFYAYACSSHVWNMTRGCLPLTAIRNSDVNALRLVL